AAERSRIQRRTKSVSSASRLRLASLRLYFSKRCTPSNRVQDSFLSPFYRHDTMVLSILESWMVSLISRRDSIARLQRSCAKCNGYLEIAIREAGARFPCRRLIRQCLKCGNCLGFFLRAYYGCPHLASKIHGSLSFRYSAASRSNSFFTSCHELQQDEKERDEIGEGRGERFLHRIETRL